MYKNEHVIEILNNIDLLNQVTIALEQDADGDSAFIDELDEEGEDDSSYDWLLSAMSNKRS